MLLYQCLHTCIRLTLNAQMYPSNLNTHMHPSNLKLTPIRHLHAPHERTCALILLACTQQRMCEGGRGGREREGGREEGREGRKERTRRHAGMEVCSIICASRVLRIRDDSDARSAASAVRLHICHSYPLCMQLHQPHWLWSRKLTFEC